MSCLWEQRFRFPISDRRVVTFFLDIYFPKDLHEPQFASEWRHELNFLRLPCYIIDTCIFFWKTYLIISWLYRHKLPWSQKQKSFIIIIMIIIFIFQCIYLIIVSFSSWSNQLRGNCFAAPINHDDYNEQSFNTETAYTSSCSEYTKDNECIQMELGMLSQSSFSFCSHILFSIYSLCKFELCKFFCSINSFESSSTIITFLLYIWDQKHYIPFLFPLFAIL